MRIKITKWNPNPNFEQTSTCRLSSNGNDVHITYVIDKDTNKELHATVTSNTLSIKPSIKCQKVEYITIHAKQNGATVGTKKIKVVIGKNSRLGAAALGLCLGLGIPLLGGVGFAIWWMLTRQTNKHLDIDASRVPNVFYTTDTGGSYPLVITLDGKKANVTSLTWSNTGEDVIDCRTSVEDTSVILTLPSTPKVGKAKIVFFAEDNNHFTGEETVVIEVIEQPTPTPTSTTLIIDPSSIPTAISNEGSSIFGPYKIKAYKPDGTEFDLTDDDVNVSITSTNTDILTVYQSAKDEIYINRESDSGTANIWIQVTTDDKLYSGGASVGVTIQSGVDPEPTKQTLIVNASDVPTIVNADGTMVSGSISAKFPNGDSLLIDETTTVNVSSQPDILDAKWNSNTNKVEIKSKTGENGSCNLYIEVTDKDGNNGAVMVGVTVEGGVDPEPVIQTLIVDPSRLPTVVNADGTKESGTVFAKFPDGTPVTIDSTTTINFDVQPNILNVQRKSADTNEIEVWAKDGETGSCNLFVEIIDKDGNRGAATVGVTIASEQTYSLTYDQLVSKITSRELTVGQQYRITDYDTTSTQEDTGVAKHHFDLLVTAKTPGALCDDATAIHSARDTSGYFINCELSVWDIKYDINNNINKYYWADDENGKGVIYYMKDEFGNECSYDFKNILFTPYGKTGDATYYTFNGTGNTDYSLDGYTNEVSNNVINSFISEDGFMILNNIVFDGNYCENNFFNNGCQDMYFKDNCSDNSFDIDCFCNVFDSWSWANTIGKRFQYNTITNTAHISYGFNNNSFGDDCADNVFNVSTDTTNKKYITDNQFGNNTTSVTISDIDFSRNVVEITIYATFDSAKYPNGIQHKLIRNGKIVG